MLTTTDILAAYLYIHLNEQMPHPVLDDNGLIDAEADNAAIEAWSLGRDTYQIPELYLRRFIVETELMLDALSDLELSSDEPASSQYMSLFYDAARTVFDNDRTQLREYFRWLYLVVFQREDGPRWGEFVDIYGVDEFCNLVRTRFASLIGG